MSNNPTTKKSSYKVLGVFLIVVVPIFVVGLSIVLVYRGVSINSLIFNSVEKNGQQLLGTSTEAKEEEKYSVFKGMLEPILTNPASIRVSRIDLEADLVPVGVEDDGTMENPEDWDKAGWFISGGLPGEGRNLIINGHYDNNVGAPAAFWSLKSLIEGDTVEVTDDYGRIYSYKVVELDYVDIKDPSRLEVLGDEEGKSTLTLITCGGVWLPNSGYNKRLIVKAELTS